MKLSQYLLTTYKETPADAELISHQYMLRAGMIRKLGSGLYTWMPLGLRVLQKIEKIVREELNAIGAIEALMPCLIPANLWQETARWDSFGKQLFKIQDRHGREFCFGPTHEEVITDIIRNDINSYKQLPLNIYQIQTKFRDEIRPRFGVMRAREFLMKDSYSFHLDTDCLEKTYAEMHTAYCQIFDRLGLTYRAVLADTGSIGGQASHEFQVLANSGEDLIFYSDQSDYAANIELAEAIANTPETIQHQKIMVKANSEKAAAVVLVLCAQHQLNTIKAEKLPEVAAPLEILAADAAHVDEDSLVIVDRSAALLDAFKDAEYIADIRNVQDGDPSPDGVGTLRSCRGIEVGHIFQLGDKYSRAMQASILDANGKAVFPMMGCYGIGISRIVAAAIEQHHDANGIIWPKAIAPFQVIIIPLNMHKSPRTQALAESIYAQLLANGVEVLFDDRKERAGVMFADADLIGIPTRLVISERGIDAGTVECKQRANSETETINIDECLAKILLYSCP